MKTKGLHRLLRAGHSVATLLLALCFLRVTAAWQEQSKVESDNSIDTEGLGLQRNRLPVLQADDSKLYLCFSTDSQVNLVPKNMFALQHSQTEMIWLSNSNEHLKLHLLIPSTSPFSLFSRHHASSWNDRLNILDFVVISCSVLEVPSTLQLCTNPTKKKYVQETRFSFFFYELFVYRLVVSSWYFSPAFMLRRRKRLEIHSPWMRRFWDYCDLPKWHGPCES